MNKELKANTMLSHYRIVSKIGAGGMGEVYRALDTRLDRDVAIKILPASYARDKNRLRRFELEARATSSLNHPNILTIYDIGEEEGVPYLVEELLEGDDLAALLAHGPLPLRRALDYAQQFASGLAAAHARDITHRDLKPGNLFVTKDGRLKILDFGLAKLKPLPFEQENSQAPTRNLLTSPGMVIGTVAYMSPEQVRGQEVDHRSDLFSFGVILYEMLSGERPFNGDSAVELMNAILKEDSPELSGKDPQIYLALDRIVRRCLEKQPARRFHSASDLGFAIESVSTISGSHASATDAHLGTIGTAVKSRLFGFRSRFLWPAAGILLVLLVALPFVLGYLQRPAVEVSAVRSYILPPENVTFRTLAHAAVSPDGLFVVFRGSSQGKTQLWLRALDSLESRALADTEDATYPFWSPDSRSVGFFAERKLKRIEVNGGPSLTICDAPEAYGGTWSRDGVIVFAPDRGTPLSRVAASGGEPTVITRLNEEISEMSHRWPHFLPDGQHFLFESTGLTSARDSGEIYVGSLNSHEVKPVLSGASTAVFADGYLLFGRDETLMAQPFDTRRLEVKGETVPLAERVLSGRGSAFSASTNGVIVYQGSVPRLSKLAWYDRAGKQMGILGDAAVYSFPRISPDETRVSVQIRDRTGNDLWLYELGRGLSNRFTFDQAEEEAIVWSPDGSSIVFATNPKGLFDIFQQSISGARSELLSEPNTHKLPSSWSRDGRFLLFTRFDRTTLLDIWVLPMEGDRKPFLFLQTKFDEAQAQFSPDGKWVAYESDESGSNEIYVAPFAGSGKWRVSASGGMYPRWRGDGREIFFFERGKLMAAEVSLGTTLKVGIVRELFETNTTSSPGVYPYDVTADGKRFLIVTREQQDSPPPITLIVNWRASLKR